MDEIIAGAIERLHHYIALMHIDEIIMEVEVQWKYPVLSEAEEEEMEWTWQSKKLEAKVWELEQKVEDFQRELEELQMAVDILQFSINAEL